MPTADNQYSFESLFKAVEMTKNIAAKACDEVERQRADTFVRDATRVLDSYGWVIQKLNQARVKTKQARPRLTFSKNLLQRTLRR